MSNIIRPIYLNKEGMFIVNTNTIIIDPRTPSAIIHELGHYIYENKLSFTYKDKRVYYSEFKGLINKFKKNEVRELKKHELEKYSDESEWFAYWFETLELGKK